MEASAWVPQGARQHGKPFDWLRLLPAVAAFAPCSSADASMPHVDLNQHLRHSTHTTRFTLLCMPSLQATIAGPLCFATSGARSSLPVVFPAPCLACSACWAALSWCSGSLQLGLFWDTTRSSSGPARAGVRRSPHAQPWCEAERAAESAHAVAGMYAHCQPLIRVAWR